MAQPLKIVFLLAAMFVLSACESDRSFDEPSGSLDIEIETAESVATGILQSTILLHKYLPITDYFGLPDLSDGMGNFETITCDGASLEHPLTIGGYEITDPAPGSALVIITRDPDSENTEELKRDPLAGEDPDSPNLVLRRIPKDKDPIGNDLVAGAPHKVGDKVTVVYNGCVNSEGLIFSGMAEFSYTELEGLNDRFTEIDTDTCVGNLTEELSLDPVPLVLFGDNISPEMVGDQLQINLDGVDSGISVDDSDRRSIILNRPGSGVTSFDGDLVYSLVERELVTEKCQRYVRTLDANIESLSVTRDDITYALDGRMELVNVSNNLDTIETAIEDANIDVTVTQNNLVQNFRFSDFSFDRTLQTSTGGLTYKIVSGRVQNSLHEGDILFLQSFVYDSQFFDYPQDGDVFLTAQGLEGMSMVLGANNNIFFQVDYNGDSNNDGLGDADETFFSTWPDLLNREFIFEE